MSIKYKKLRILKLTQKEYEHVLFIRNEMPFGQATLITHNGEPAKVIDIKKDKVYGTGEEVGNELNRGSQDG